jgi:Big-like domain-containing protein
MARQHAWFRRPAWVGAMAALSGFGAACAPNQGVPSGAPVLYEIKIIQSGATVTTITADTPDCPADGGNISGTMCAPTASALDLVRTGPAPICRSAANNTWCRCNANPTPAAAPSAQSCTDGGATDAGGGDAGAAPDAADASADAADAPAMLGGTWDCSAFSPTAQPLFVFDRLLDSKPLDPGDAAALTQIASVTVTPPAAMPVAVAANYASNGSPNETLFSLFTFRADGPSLFFSGDPALPVNSIVRLTLDATKVLAKDGKTPFTATGTLGGGSLAFTTGGFSASISTPPTEASPADAGACTPPPTVVKPDQTPVTITFTNIVDPSAIAANVTVSATPVAGGAGTPVPFDAASTDGLNVTLTPHMNWPASSVITVTLAATAADVLGEQLGAAGAPPAATFTTGAM